MADVIKYSASAQTLALKEGNFWIGVGDVSKGTTVNTDYYNGITPPTGGYTIYLNKASQGPSIYVASSDAELISLTNKIAGTSYTTVYQCVNYLNTQTDKMVLNIDYPAIPTNGITFISDIGTTLSYPLGGSTSSSIDPVGNGGYIFYQNGPVYVSEYGGGFQFDGADDLAYTSISTGGFGTLNTAAFTWVMICRSTQTTWSANGGMGSNRYNDGTGWSMNNVSASRNITFYMGNTSNAFTVNIGTITPTDITIPHMYVISSNGTNLHKGYVDNGSPITSSTSITRAAAQHEIIFGRDGYVAGTNLKMVSYVQIMYNRQLSDTEVLSLCTAYQDRFLLGFDADAIAFISAASITNTTQRNAINTLVTDLKAASIWTKMQAIYPFVGGSATSHKFNLKDPRDLDSAYRIVFYGGWTHNSDGIQADGSTGYADTFAAAGSSAIPNRANHWSSYIKQLPSQTRYTGIFDYPSTFSVFGYYAGQFTNWFMGLQSFAGTGISCQTGFINGTVTSSTNGVLYYNGSSIYSVGSVGFPLTSFQNAYTYYLGAYNYAQSPSSYNDQRVSFASLGNSLTATDAANLYTAVQKFQTSLGRQV
jgi:hypothetical protein